MDENRNYFKLMEKLGKPFCKGTLPEMISHGERLLVAAMRNLFDEVPKDRRGIELFLKKNPEIKEALEKAKDVFGFFRMCLNMQGQASAAWYKT